MAAISRIKCPGNIGSGTRSLPGFDDAVIRHRLLAAIEQAARGLSQAEVARRFRLDRAVVNNWVNVPDAKTRYYDAAMRHLDAWHRGEVNDEESGLPHLAHAACCLLFVMWFDGKSVS